MSGSSSRRSGCRPLKQDDEDLAKVYAKVGVTAKDMNAEAIAKWKALAQATAWKDFRGAECGLRRTLLKLAEAVA